ncbi:auxin-responsive protein IAA33 [Macadamia integrifolia]|uniref:auxin-responsive protein IAA33 n=1 Tax=Macadamia integrifolia TaxID=60698 RepID=UPI001C52CAC3|nr:auxin-responsive protein IAA33 [Macadamia integrifolia]
MNGFDSHHDFMKRRWQEMRLTSGAAQNQRRNSTGFFARLDGATTNTNNSFLRGGEDDNLSTVIPPVTVVLEGRSICQRISLHKHTSYQSLAKALRQMFVDAAPDATGGVSSEIQLDLSNAVPGHLVAYEDMEDDLLLAGDLNWKDFVRVAKRIRIIPVKENSRRGRGRS